MNAASADILNLLLGIAPAATGNGPVVSDGTAEGPSFDMLFGSLMSAKAGNVPQQQVSPVAGGADRPAANHQRFDWPGLVNKPPDESSAGRVAANEPELARTDASAGQPKTAVEVEDQIPKTPNSRRTDRQPADGTERPVQPAPFRVSPLGYEAARVAAANGVTPLQATAGWDQIDLEPGRYAVLDWSRTGDVLNLEVAPVENPSKTIKIVVPAGQMQLETPAQTATVSNAAKRVALDGQPEMRGQTAERLNGLFEKLNVKELVVKAPQQQAADNATVQWHNEKIELRLFAENAGQQVMLRTSLARDVVRTHPKQEGGVRMEQAAPKMTDNPVSFETSGTPSGEKAVHANAAVRTGWDMRFGTENFHELPPQKLGVGKSDADPKSGTAGLPDFIRSSTELTADRQGNMIPRGRFTLPDEARMTLRPNGRSVQLKIDPEHLGPARLSLTMNNDRLHALVVVDSTQAKQTVEASLDRLIDTLARADIKVDAIDVEIDQRGSDERLFEQQANGRRIGSFARLGDSESENEIAAGAAASGASWGAVSYVGTGGVNVLA